MNENKTYNVGEFARLAGVTRRTLHHYDDAGLLKPQRHTVNGRRRYQETDLLRLQQITTLKYMGFSLKDIERLLSSPAYDLKSSLTIQREAINGQIQQLQGAYYALSQMIKASEADAGVDWESVIAVIRQLTDVNRGAWLQRYFTDETTEALRDRAAYGSPEAIEAGTEAWEKLYADFRAVSHLTPADSAVQKLAKQMDDLIHRFTGGNSIIDHALGEAYANLATNIAEVTPADQSLQAFMTAALIIYRTGGM